MDTADAVIEAEVELDSEALRQEEARHRGSHGQKSVEIAKPGIDISAAPVENDGEQAATEESPLLPRDGEEPEDNRGGSHMDEFANLPWYKRPNIFWVLGPFFLLACAFGGIITPRVNLILELVCRKYISERQIWDPGFTMAPVNFENGDDDQCRTPEVQSRVAMMMLWASLIAGLLAAITSPKLGALSDRYGRKKLLMITSIGTIVSEIIFICAATYPETFPVNLLLLSFAAEGLTGSFIVAMAIANAYAADCTPPARRNVAFGYFHGCLFTGIAIGPILAGYIVQITGQIVTVFWIMTIAHIFFIIFTGLFVPESLSPKRQLAAREKHNNLQALVGPEMTWAKRLRSLNLLEPLKVLWPTGPGSSAKLRRNLFFLAAVDTIVFGVSMGSMTVVITYTNYMFGWKTFESGRFLTVVNSCRVFCLLVVLPTLTRLVRGKADRAGARKSTGCDAFDIGVIRTAVFFDTVGYIGFTLSRSGSLMILSGAIAAIGGIASPTLQSSLTKHVPADQTGQLLGASSLLHALARVVAPTIFNGIYASTVKVFPQTVFVCLASTFGFAFIISWFLRTHIYFDEDRAEQAANDPDNTSYSDNTEGERLPIVGAVLAAFGAIFACMGLRSRT